MHITRGDDSHIYVSYYQWLGSFSFKLAQSVQLLKVYFCLFGLWTILYFSSEKFVLLGISLSSIYEGNSFLFLTCNYMVTQSNSTQLFQFCQQIQQRSTKTKSSVNTSKATEAVFDEGQQLWSRYTARSLEEKILEFQLLSLRL